jgi:hypothetical protein
MYYCSRLYVHYVAKASDKFKNNGSSGMSSGSILNIAMRSAE